MLKTIYQKGLKSAALHTSISAIGPTQFITLMAQFVQATFFIPTAQLSGNLQEALVVFGLTPI